jgi:hypothetical protein
VCGIAQLHADREIKASGAAAEASNLHACRLHFKPMRVSATVAPAVIYFKLKLSSLKIFYSLCLSGTTTIAKSKRDQYLA